MPGDLCFWRLAEPEPTDSRCSAELFLNAAEVYRQLWSTIARGEEWRGELRNRKKNGDVWMPPSV